jgi:hypothetical protein
MKALWTKLAMPVCMPPVISEHNTQHTQRAAHRKEDESEITNGNRIRRSNRSSESGNSQPDEAMH